MTETGTIYRTGFTNYFAFNNALSFPGYYRLVHLLDIEWLLSTLFDASLLST